MKNKNQFRQGDVFIEKVNDVPSLKNAKDAKDNGRVILAHGEVTGHCHEVIDHADDAELTTNDSEGSAKLVLKVGRKTNVKHQEHAPVTLEPGCYRITRQREYSPSEIRNVAD